jgi:hypothetical protein
MQQALSKLRKSGKRLRKPSEFQREHTDLFRTYSALRYYLDRRHENGLLATGAVVETALGLRVDEQRFPVWLMGSSQSTQPAGDEAA